MSDTPTPMKAIRQKCLQCCCEQPKEVRLCTVERCALWPYRMGHRPKDTDGGISKKSMRWLRKNHQHPSPEGFIRETRVDEKT